MKETPDVSRAEAISKQIGMEPLFLPPDSVTRMAYCRKCRAALRDCGQKYCSECGQAIMWPEVNA